MNTFRKNYFWFISAGISALYAVWTFKIMSRNSMIKLHELVETELNEFLMLALILPVFTGIIIKAVAEQMYYTKMLGYGSRKKWHRKIARELLINSIWYVFIILSPIVIEGIILSNGKYGLEDYAYGVFTYVTYTLLMTLIAFIAYMVKIQWNIDILTLMSVLFISFMPYVVTRLFIRKHIITFSDIANASYLFTESGYVWFFHEIMCVLEVVIIICIYKFIRRWIINKDLLWRNDEV